MSERLDGRPTREFRSDEDRAIAMALELATELTYEGQHFAAGTIRALLEHLRAARGEEAAAALTPSPREVPAEVVADAPVAPKPGGAKRGRPPKKPAAEAPAELQLGEVVLTPEAPPVVEAPVAEVPAQPAAPAVSA